MTKMSLPSQLRSFVGYDDLIDRMWHVETEKVSNYPPYNITKEGDNEYMIEIACSGFQKSDIEISKEGDVLSVDVIQQQVDNKEREYLHRGLAFRPFTRKFTLHEHIEVTDAKMENGLLKILLVRNVPDKLLPKKIEIK